MSNPQESPSMSGPEVVDRFSDSQLFAARIDQVTPASASQKTPEWVAHQVLSPGAAATDADVNDNDNDEEEPAWALTTDAEHEVLMPDQLGTASSTSSELESIHSFSELLLSNDQDESPQPSAGSQEGHEQDPSTDGQATTALLDRASTTAPNCSLANDQASTGAPAQVHLEDVAHAASGSTEAELTPAITSAVPVASAAGSADPALEKSVARTSMETPDLLQTPAEAARAASGSFRTTTGGGVPFCETVMRGAAIVQNALWEDSPSDALGCSGGNAVLPGWLPAGTSHEQPINTAAESCAAADAYAAGLSAPGSAPGSASDAGRLGDDKGIAGEGLGAAITDGAKPEDAAEVGSVRRARLQNLAMRRSVSRAPSFLSQLSTEDGPPEEGSLKLRRPASSPAYTNAAPQSRGMWGGGRRAIKSYQGRSKASSKAFPASPRPLKPRARGQVPLSQSFEGLQLQYNSLQSQVATLHVGADSRSQLQAAAKREAELRAQLDAMRSKVQAEADARQEAQAKLAEHKRQAEKERKALGDQLEGKLRAARKELALLRSQMVQQSLTPQQKVTQLETDTVQLTSDELGQISREMDGQEKLIRGYQVEIEAADVRQKALQQEVKDLKTQIGHLEICLQDGQAEKTRPKPNAPDAAQNLAAVLELQRQLQCTRDVAAERENELALQITQLKSSYAIIKARLLDSEEAHTRAEERAARAEEEVASLKRLHAQTGQGDDAQQLQQQAKQISTLQARLEATGKAAGAAQERTTQLQAILVDTQRDLARKEAAIEEYCRADEARKQHAASRRLSASASQKENKGASPQSKVQELESQLNDERRASARRESLLKNQLKAAKQEAPTRTSTSRLPRPPCAAQQPQRLKETIARLEADLAASKGRIHQLEKQVGAQEAAAEEHATARQALEGANVGLAELSSKCTDLEAELADKRQEVQEAAGERARLAAELAATGQRVAAAEMAHRLLLRDRDTAIEQRAAQHHLQMDAARAEAAQEAAAAESRAWTERVAAAEAATEKERRECERLQGELRAARRGVAWTPKAAEFEAVQQKIRGYQASEEARIARALQASEEAHKEQIAAKEVQIACFRQELDAIFQQLESLKQPGA